MSLGRRPKRSQGLPDLRGNHHRRPQQPAAGIVDPAHGTAPQWQDGIACGSRKDRGAQTAGDGEVKARRTMKPPGRDIDICRAPGAGHWMALALGLEQ